MTLPGFASRVGRSIESWRRDAGYSARLRCRSPLATAIIITTLALGIGISTTVFSIADAVLLSALPFPDEARLVALRSIDSLGREIGEVSADNWSDWRSRSRTLADAAIYLPARFSVVARGPAFRAPAAWVSPNLLSMMPARFVHGGNFDSTAVAAGAGGVIVSEALWRREFEGTLEKEPAITINGRQTRVIGVVAERFAFPEGTQIWVPYSHRIVGGAERNNMDWRAIGRLRADASIESARADLSMIARSIREADPIAIYSAGVGVVRLRDEVAGNERTLVLMLVGAAILLLLIMSANLASLGLAGGSERFREFSVRTALGATKAALLQQVLIDYMVLSAIGTVLGVALAWGLVLAVSRLDPVVLPRAGQVRVSEVALAVSVSVGALVGMFSAALPAAHAARRTPNELLRSRTPVRGLVHRVLTVRALVAGQIALTFVLLTAAGLLTRSLSRVQAQPLGFDVRHVATAEILLGGPRFRDDSVAVLGYWERLLDQLRSLPGATDAALTASLPLIGGGTGFVEVEGNAPNGAVAGYQVVSDGYLRTLGIRRVAGRDFDPRDGAGTTRVALVNSKLAALQWPDQSALGGRIRATSMEATTDGSPPPWITVIGVVDDVRHHGYTTAPAPEMYVLHRQLTVARLLSLTAIVKGTTTDAALTESVRGVVRTVDSSIPADIAMLAALGARQTAPRSFAMLVLLLFGLGSLLLSTIGVFAMLAGAVERRKREIAVRVALGGDRRAVRRVILVDATLVVGAGLGVGALTALAAIRPLESLLYGISVRDPLVFVVALAAVTLAGTVAIIVPVRRALSIEPMGVLRSE